MQILSQMQWVNVHGKAPIDFRRHEMPFKAIWGSAHWEFENLALFNQAAYSNVANRNKSLDEDVTRLKAYVAQAPQDMDDEQHEYFNIALSRIRESITAGEIEVDAISRYADQVTVIAAWALVEKFLNKGLMALQALGGLLPAAGHGLIEIKEAYLECGIDLEVANSYADADECRLLNNAIKHTGVVGDYLAQRSAFDGLTGKDLDRIDLDTQRYYFGAADFVGAVYELCSVQLDAAD